jgi:PilZ domain
VLFFPEKDNKLSIGDEFRRLLERYPFLKFEFQFTRNHQFGFVFPTVTPVSSETRQYIRFSITLQARRQLPGDRISPVLVKQISLGGCMVEWDENAAIGEKIRIEVLLANGNWLPLTGKILYRMPENGLGIKFQEITQFEQEILANLIQIQMERRGLPYQNPFALPEVSKIGNNIETKKTPNLGTFQPQQVLN